MSGNTNDEYDALRIIVQTLEAFGPDDRSRILRWTGEKLGLSQQPQKQKQSTSADIVTVTTSEPDGAQLGGAKDIKSFVAQKKPKNDTQFAAVVAYYYRFEAADKKNSITQTDLLDACRLTNSPRPPAPGQTLRNAVNAGLLDKADRGAFAINSVGENLVAVTLPNDVKVSAASPSSRTRKKRGATKKKASSKKTTAKK